MEKEFELIAKTFMGLEPVLAKELTQLGANDIAARCIERLPDLRRPLATDVDAAYKGDPAAANVGEIIPCYPVIKALPNYRIAHELH